MRKLRLLAIGSSTLLACAAAHPQPYPSKSIRVIVASAPGGNPDINSRNMANELSKQLGQQVVIENRPGASGIIGLQALARAAPDGYTIGYISNLVASNPGIYAKLPYDFVRDFAPIMLYLSGLNLLTVHPSLPVRSVKELINLAKANPGKLSYGTSGVGASPHLSMELFKTMTGTSITHVSYKGSQQAVTDLISGQIDIVCDNMGPLLPQVRAGRLRALGVTALNRSPVLPELPTLDEAGIPGFELTTWGGFAMPAGTPQAIVQRMNAEMNKALSSPAVLQGLTAISLTPEGGTPERFAEHVRLQTDKLGRLIKSIGIEPQ
ncbi:MAG TPA: tripartite tricarboxylate transporter substrate binding protein [Burkholderiales bacterium]|jgi:tripartite-type tricarboxylate transporter receptor subunit TctC|nr:tripartite tricarboxylate transporter substrate binding protein [Burkholderiales bacterium]